MIFHLIYTSHLTLDASQPEGWNSLLDIVSRARIRNRANGITGHVVVGPHWALQLIEGERGAVMQTFQRIMADPRHCSPRLLDLRVAPDRLCPEMALSRSLRTREDMGLDHLREAPEQRRSLDFLALLARSQASLAAA